MNLQTIECNVLLEDDSLSLSLSLFETASLSLYEKIMERHLYDNVSLCLAYVSDYT
jgi:hypothetical protein